MRHDLIELEFLDVLVIILAKKEKVSVVCCFPSYYLIRFHMQKDTFAFLDSSLPINCLMGFMVISNLIYDPLT